MEALTLPRTMLGAMFETCMVAVLHDAVKRMASVWKVKKPAD